MNGTKIVNRRHGPDVLVKAISIISGISWLIVFVVFILVSYAKPKMETLFDRQYNIQLRQNWDKTMLGYAIFLLGLITVICLAGILINMSRHRRRTDRYNKSLIFFCVGSIIGILVYLVFG